tara:strand:+ start:88 stop:441 length:354 start_codon:yes stop_codon:yes gene_type:complete
MIKIGKYKFDSREEALKRIDYLGVVIDEDGSEYPAHNNAVIHLGNITLQDGKYDEGGHEKVAPVLSKEWHVDVLWVGLIADKDGKYKHPYGWAGKAVDVRGNGIHAFFGLDYDNLKL